MKTKDNTMICALKYKSKTKKPMKSEIEEYIAQRYDRWFDYSAYHCTLAGIADEAVDVLNEVLIMLLEKVKDNPEQIKRLYESKKGKYRELDFFVLQMIKLNITSPTSPYQHKYRPIPSDDNVDLSRLDLIDDPEEARDYPAEIATEMELVRFVYERLYLDDIEKQAFKTKFFEGESISSVEFINKRKLYNSCQVVHRAINRILADEGVTKTQEKKKNGKDYSNQKIEKRAAEIVKVFKICHPNDLKNRINQRKYILK